tara:strand:+ start:126001 stop:126192 length:192 start_codon:yes stop_codon:yes gene_type:complete
VLSFGSVFFDEKMLLAFFHPEGAFNKQASKLQCNLCTSKENELAQQSETKDRFGMINNFQTYV